MSNSQKWLLGDVKLKITRSPDPEILVFLHVCLVVWMWGIVVAENVLERVVGRRKRKCCEVTGVYFELVGPFSPPHLQHSPNSVHVARVPAAGCRHREQQDQGTIGAGHHQYRGWGICRLCAINGWEYRLVYRVWKADFVIGIKIFLYFLILYYIFFVIIAEIEFRP